MRSAQLTGAELAGYVVSITVWGHFLSQAAHSLTWLPTLVRIASSIFIAYLAIRMWRTAVLPPTSAQQAIGLRTLFVATLFNPKAILFAGTIFPAVAFASLPAYFETMAIFATLLIPIGLVWVAFGAALGIGLALALVQIGEAAVASFLYRVNPRDPLVYVGVVALVAVATVMACFFPARRATKVDPMVALRCE